ncbi:MAG TPA: aldolase/citrate lyase family protein [Stenotrophomonas sp.]|nr:aldolase/citrate lyase family protein [Stenotrophomonas sp.]
MPLKARLEAGATVHGVFCAIASPVTVELAASAGYDFVIIDLEHALVSPDTLAAMLLAARAGRIAALVRVAHRSQVFPALDMGAQGIVFPRVSTVAQARAAVRACRHWPLGQRGTSATHHSGYGRDDLAAAQQCADALTLVVVMIEDAAAAERSARIAAVEGVDVLLEGAADLAQSLGLPWQTRHPRVREAIERIECGAMASGKYFCALPRAPEDRRRWAERGVRMFILGEDRGLLRAALAARLDGNGQHAP